MKLFTGGVCIALAVLEIAHPTSASAASAWWQALHAALLLGYALLYVLLWRRLPLPMARAARRCHCGDALAHAVLTRPDRISAKARARLDLLIGRHLPKTRGKR